MGPFLGQAVDALLGRSSLRFQFEITPQFVADLPSEVTAVTILWEKGSKISYTDPADVNFENRTAAFAQVMRQTASVYKHDNALLPKFYTFKLQSVQSGTPSSSCSSTVSTPGAAQPADISGRRKTIARARLNLAQFCSAESAGPGPAVAVQVPLEPQGTLHLSIRTVWLQHYDRSKSAQMQQQAPERSAAQLWGSSSDSVATTYTDKSSATSSIVGSYLGEADRATCSGSAELDRLLLEAEAATAAKTVPTGAGKGAASNCLMFKPRVVTLDALSTAAAAAAVPRGPSKQHHKTPSTASKSPVCSQQAAHQHVLAGQSVLDILDARNSAPGSASSQPSPFASGALTYNSLHGSSRSSGEGRADSPFGDSRRWHRRASSVPDTPPILEADTEGIDVGSFTGAQHPVLTSNTDGDQHTQSQAPAGVAPALPAKGPISAAVFPFGMKGSSAASTEGSFCGDSDEEDDAAAVWMDVCSSDTAAAMQGCAQQLKGAADGPEGLRSLSGRMPTWLWPSSRLAVRDLTTDQIMRRISSSRALQHMCRGLLCERNDWRFRATQAERVNASLQQELHQLRTSESEAQQQLQQQLSERQLVHKLVDAKLQLAQADLSMQDMKRQLERERKRHVQALAMLTSLQANFDQYIHDHTAAGLDCCKPVSCYV